KGIAEIGVIDEIQPTELLKKYDRRDQLRTLCRGHTVVSIDPRYFRPTEVDTLLGDPSKAQRKLGWEQKISFKQMIREMVDNDLKDGMREAIWKQKGFTVPESFEANM
ncbi:MAG: GDP-mannose 4,6-dehydratase, partial [Deltaproteobacteria bacterium]|nr:GDP-mannose 4,6-dehydratase [Deltaproteobacteria bacterium]